MFDRLGAVIALPSIIADAGPVPSSAPAVLRAGVYRTRIVATQPEAVWFACHTFRPSELPITLRRSTRLRAIIAFPSIIADAGPVPSSAAPVVGAGDVGLALVLAALFVL